MRKKILFLGAAHTQLPPLIYARSQGHWTITCDYLPDNPGHKLANESYPLSTTDKEAVLDLASSLNIDGVVAYATDPAAPTAAFVAENLGLPGNPYDSVLTLARKDSFRAFLDANGFNVPKSRAFSDTREARNGLRKWVSLPILNRSTHLEAKALREDDSSGLYRRICTCSEILSRETNRYRAGDCADFQSGCWRRVCGKRAMLAFRCWADEHFDKLCNGLVPIGQTFPTVQSEDQLMKAHVETQRLLSLLGIKTGALNFDIIFDDHGELYFLEIGPRNGGCLIPEVIRYATGVDLIKYTKLRMLQLT